jgi:ABC-type Na+ efflux pump permease subunit
MKKLFVLIVLLVVGYLAYQKFVVNAMSDEQKQVQAIADEFSAVKQQMAQAERTAGATGVDTTSDIDSGMQAAGAMLEKLQALQEKLTEDKAVAMAEKLAGELSAFLSRTK